MCLGIPGKVVDIIDSNMTLAMVEIAGEQRPVNIAFVVDAAHPAAACLGEWVLVHLGFAIRRLDEAEAALTLALLTQLGEAQAEIDARHPSAA
ncbi:MAG: hypC2 [Proteobacteria bacterium]|nr:hypC2 [Pseudomonadota bacterium]